MSKQNTPTQNFNNLKEINEHSNPDYPVGVYYVEPHKMYLGHVPVHWHEEFEIDLVKNGRVMYYFGRESVCISEGQAILIVPNMLHAIYPFEDENCEIISIVFNTSILFPSKENVLYQNYYLGTISRITNGHLIYDRKNLWDRAIIDSIEDIISLNFDKEYGYELMTQSTLAKLWLFFSKNLHQSNPVSNKSTSQKLHSLSPDEVRVKEIINYIKSSYNEPISLDDIAMHVHLSKSECCRCFKRVSGITPFEYLMHYRIHVAADIILKEQKEKPSISELAGMVGFNNISYFNKLFKEYIGYTPTQYRKLCKTEHRDRLSNFGLSLSHI